MNFIELRTPKIFEATGDDSLIGANAVVVKDIPDNCIALGFLEDVHREIPPNSLNAKDGLLMDSEEII